MRGSLEAAQNKDVYCSVRSGQKGSNFATTIKWLIDAGSEVKKGDILIELDSSGFQTSLEDQEIKVQQASAAWVKAKDDCNIQAIQNQIDIALAKSAMALAEIDLKKYIESEFAQSLEDVEGRIKIAQAELQGWEDTAAYSREKLSSGHATKSQVEADELRVQAARFNLQKVETERRSLVQYFKPRTEQDLKAKLSAATSDLERVELQAKGKLNSLEADRDAAKPSISRKNSANENLRTR